MITIITRSFNSLYTRDKWKAKTTTVAYMSTFVEYTRSCDSSRIKFVAWSNPLNTPCIIK